jgi:hypothetical protein
VVHEILSPEHTAVPLAEYGPPIRQSKGRYRGNSLSPPSSYRSTDPAITSPIRIVLADPLEAPFIRAMEDIVLKGAASAL